MMQEPNIRQPDFGPSGYTPGDVERSLLVAYDYCRQSLDHAALTERVLQGLFTAGVVEYFSVMSQARAKPLRETLFDVLDGDGQAGIGMEVLLHYHDAKQGPGPLIRTFEFFKTIRDKGMAHKDKNRFDHYRLEEDERWVSLPKMPPRLSKHPLYVKDGASMYYKMAVPKVPEEYKHAMIDLIAVTIQILRQKPDMLGSNT